MAEKTTNTGTTQSHRTVGDHCADLWERFEAAAADRDEHEEEACWKELDGLTAKKHVGADHHEVAALAARATQVYPRKAS